MNISRFAVCSALQQLSASTGFLIEATASSSNLLHSVRRAAAGQSVFTSTPVDFSVKIRADDAKISDKNMGMCLADIIGFVYNFWTLI